jgi:VCBS repeat protein/FG-GAP repeat protein
MRDSLRALLISGLLLVLPLHALNAATETQPNPRLPGAALGSNRPRSVSPSLASDRGQVPRPLGPTGFPTAPSASNTSLFPRVWTTSDSRINLAAAWGDVNEDGRLDLVTATRSYPEIFLNTEQGLGPVPDRTLNTSSDGVAFGDIDGDGKLDLVCAGVLGLPNAVYLNKGGDFSDPPDWVSADSVGSRDVVLGDVDNDGDLDVFFSSLGGANRLYRNDNGRFTALPVWTSEKKEDSWSLAVGDLNGDGWLDLACANSRSDLPDTILSFGSQIVPAGDVNGDGFADLLVRGYQLIQGISHDRIWLFYGGTQMDRQADLVLESRFGFGGSLSSAGDLNGDGFGDLIVTSYQVEGDVAADVYLGSANPDTTVDLVLRASGQIAYSTSLVGDVNGDGYSDVLVAGVGQAYVYFGGAVPDTVPDLVLDGRSGGEFTSGSVCSADMNGDGFSDIVASAPYGQLGRGQTYVYFGGSSPDSIPDLVLGEDPPLGAFGIAISSIGDLNRDGFEDIAVGSRGSASSIDAGKIYIYLGGTTPDSLADFVLSGSAPGDGFGESISGLGDVNGDGFSDFIVGAWSSNATEFDAGQAYVYFGGTILDPNPDLVLADGVYADEFGSVVASAGDLNGDGFADIAVGSTRSDTGGDGAGQAFLYFGGRNADASPDVRLIGGTGKPWKGLGHSIYFNQGGGVFPSSPSWRSQSQHWSTFVALGDLDGDGDLDPVFADVFGDQRPDLGDILFFRNDGDSIETQPAWVSPFHTYQSVCLADMDKDGDLDIVAAYQTSATLVGNAPNQEVNEIYMNTGGTFPASPKYIFGADQGSPQAIVPGDVDHDGDLDLLVAMIPHNVLYRNDQTAVFSGVPIWSSAITENSHGVAVGDLDRDGTPDLVFANVGRQAAYYNRNGSLETTPSWRPSVLSPQMGAAVVLGDVDGNGFPDALFVTNGFLGSGNATQSFLHLNFGGTLSGAAAFSQDAFMADHAALVDLDGDGTLDLVRPGPGFGPCPNQQPNTILYGLTPTFSGSSTRLIFVPGSNDVAVADLDGDGDLDLAFANRCDGKNPVYFNDNGSFPDSANWSPFYQDTDSWGVAAGDLTGDGLTDLVYTHLTGIAEIYRNSGNGSWSFNYYIYSNPATRVALGDLNGDGWLDAVFAGNGSKCSAFLNTGSSLSGIMAWQESAPHGTQDLALADMDLDGDLDLVCANSGQPNLIYGGLHNFNSGRLLTNHSESIQGLSVTVQGTRYSFRFTARDAESDPIRIFPEYRIQGDVNWQSMVLDGNAQSLGPLASSPSGTEHTFSWDAAALPITSKEVVIRLRWTSVPRRVSLIREANSYLYNLGSLPRRSRIGVVDTIALPQVTVGDTSQVALPIVNQGNAPLNITELRLPTSVVIPRALPIVISPGRTDTLMVELVPRTVLPATERIEIVSNDPVTLLKAVDLQTPVVDLEARVGDLGGQAKVPLGKPLTIGVSAVAPSHVEGGFLFYRPYGGMAFRDSIPLSPIVDAFVATIPGEGVTELGVEYYVRVENSGVTRNFPPGAPEATVYRKDVEAPRQVTAVAQNNSASGHLAGVADNVLISLPTGTVFQSGRLFFRQGGEAVYDSTGLASNGILIGAAIPDTVMGPRGVEYWVRVVTAGGSVLSDPPSHPAATPLFFPTVVSHLAEPGTHPGNMYRIVSVPLDFGPDFTGSLAALLTDQPEFGTYDPRRWRCFLYAPPGYTELSSGGDFTPRPGRAFWLISKAAHRIDTAPIVGFSTPTAQAFLISLAPGWNMVGNPFAFPVAWSQVSVNGVPSANQVDVEPPQAWTGTTYASDQTVLQPFTGYWIMNHATNRVDLEVPPLESAAPAASPLVRSSPSSTSDTKWTIQIAATIEEIARASAEAGVDPGAASGLDPLDRSAPPLSPGSSLAIYFPGGNSDEQLSRDIRNAGSDPGGQVWRLDLAKNFSQVESGDAATLTFDVTQVPEGEDVQLVDRTLGRFTDLRAVPSYSFLLAKKEPSSDLSAARFELLAGSPDFVRNQRQISTTPFVNRLFQNSPNPFLHDTVIRYEVAKTTPVRIEIFDVEGRLVRRMADDVEPPGRYELTWDGRDGQGRETGPGIYFCHARTGGDAETRRMIRIR